MTRPFSSSSRRRLTRRALLLSGVVGTGLVFVMQPASVSAEAFKASPAVVSGSVTFDRATPNVDRIIVNTPTAIVNWRPTIDANPIDFLPAGTTATFTNGLTADFVILNRIISLNPARFDGTLISQLSPSPGSVAPGGTVIFAAPGGIIVGGKAVFDVGNLVLTSLNVIDDGAGNFLTAEGGLRFDSGDKQPTAAVVIEPGGRIFARSPNSYVSLVAPVVNQSGDVRVNGSTAYVAAEQAEISVNAGVFDIVVTTGTDNAVPLTHAGTTGGPPSTGAADVQNIYMVAIPKSQAIQMLLGGTVGYDLAAGVTPNGEILISAGYDVPNGVLATTPVNPNPADIIVKDGTFLSNLTGQASRDALVTAGSGTPINFSGSLSLQAARNASLTAVGDTTIAIGGNLNLVGRDPANNQGSNALLEAGAGAKITIAGAAVVSADTFPDLAKAFPTTGADLQGGVAAARASGGAIDVTGALTVSALGVGGFATDSGGRGTGGSASLRATGGGTVTARDDVSILATGTGGAGAVATGAGVGGGARVDSEDATIAITGNLLVDASGFAGRDTGAGTAAHGTARGGDVDLVASLTPGAALGPGAVTAGGNIALRATAGEDSQLGGPASSALGGRAGVVVAGGTLTTGELSLRTVGVAGAAPDSTLGVGGAGFVGEGGNASFTSNDGIVTLNALRLDSTGRGGEGGAGLTGGVGGEGRGGTAQVALDSRIATIGQIHLAANGIGGAGGMGRPDAAGNPGNGGLGGLGRGGSVSLGAGLGGGATFDNNSFEADGFGGTGGDGSTGPGEGGDGGDGGAGSGGNILIQTVSGGRLRTTSLEGMGISPTGFGGQGGNGGNAVSDAAGDGGDGGFGTGGNGEIRVVGGDITSPFTEMHSSGIGGAAGASGTSLVGGGAGGNPGNGTGGFATISVANGTIPIATLGSASLGATDMSASGVNGAAMVTAGDTAGRITILDNATGAADGLTMTSLRAVSIGTSGPGDAFTFQSLSPTEIAGNVVVDVPGPISITISAPGGLFAGGSVSMNSHGGLLSISHNNNVGNDPSIEATSITLTSTNTVNAGIGTRLRSTLGDIVITAPVVRTWTTDAARDLIVNGADIAMQFGAVGRDIRVTSTGNVDLNLFTFGDDLTVTAGTTFTATGLLTGTGLGSDSEAGAGPLAGTGNFVATANGALRADNADVAGRLQLTSTAGSVSSNNRLEADGAIQISAGDDIDIELADAGATLTLNATDQIDAATLDAEGMVTTTSAGLTHIGQADSRAGISVAVTAGLADLDRLNAALDIVVGAPNIDLDRGTAGRDLLLTSAGNIIANDGRAGDDFRAIAGGTFTGGTVTATGLGSDSEAGAGALGGAGNIDIDAGGNLRLDNGDAAGRLRLASATGSVLSATRLQAGSAISIIAGDDILIEDVDSGSTLLLDAADRIDADVIDAEGQISTVSGGATALDGATSRAGIDVRAGALADLDDTNVAVDMVVVAPTINVDRATAGRDITLTATGNIVVVSGRAGDDFRADAGGTFLGLTIVATGLGTDTEDGAGVLAGAGNIDVDAVGNLRLDDGTASRNLRLASANASVLSATRLIAGGAVSLSGGDDVAIATADAGTTLTLNATDDVTATLLDADGAISSTAGDATTITTAASRSSISVDTGVDAILGNFTAATDLTFGAVATTITSATAGRDITFTRGRTTVTTAQAGDDFTVRGSSFTGATVNVGGGADSEAGGGPLAGTGNVDVETVGRVQLDNSNATGRVRLSATDDSVFVGGIISAADFNARGFVFTMNPGSRITAPVFTVEARTGRATLQDVTATTSATIRSINDATVVLGAVRSPTITISSKDIDISATGTLGDATTNRVSLNAVSADQLVVLGGAAAGPGYTLTDAEADRITARTLAFDATRIGAPAGENHLVIRDLSLATARIGALEITSGGIVQVEGALALTDAVAASTLSIRADGRLQVVNPAGSIRLRDVAGLPTGTLTLASSNLWSANQALIEQLRADPNFAGRDAALLGNGGAVAPRGYIEAGDVVLEVRDTLFVQNSGTPFAFGGITVLQNTLTVRPTGATPLVAYAFGARVNPDGSLVTNEPFFREVLFEGVPTRFTDASEFNRCVINTGVCAPPIGGGPGGPGDGPTPPDSPDFIEEPVGEGGINIQLAGTEAEDVDASFAADSLIEEPVTSGSDSVLWDCDRDDDGDCDGDDTDG